MSASSTPRPQFTSSKYYVRRKPTHTRGNERPSTEDSSAGQAAQPGSSQGLADVLGELLGANGPESGKTTVGDIVESFGPQSFGPLLLATSLVSLLPVIGSIPGLSIALALIVLILAGQLALGRKTVWLPDFVEKWSVPQDKLDAAIQKVLPTVQRFDRLLQPRLPMLSSRFANRITASLCAALAVSMVPLDFIPYAVTVPSIAIALLALGITTRDGVVLSAGYVLTAASAAFTVWMMS